MTDSELGFYYARVEAAERLSPNMIRIEFGGDDLTRYVSIDQPDESVGIYFPSADELQPPPMSCREGQWGYHDASTQRVGRNYTVRRVNRSAGTVVIDFVTHDGGVAATWARRAAPGDEVLLTTPRAWYSPPDSAEWKVFVADLAGLPALCRAVEELSEGERAYVIGEVLATKDIPQFETRGVVEASWSVGTGNGRGPSVLADEVRQFEQPAGVGYLWFGGEASCSRSVRKHLRRVCGWSTAQYDVIGYWRADSEQWLRAYEAVESEVVAVYLSALDAGVDEKEAQELYEDKLESVGL